MKILFLTHYPQLYGANRSLIDLITGLTKLGHKIIAVSPLEGDFSNALNKLCIENYIIPFRLTFTNKPSDEQMVLQRITNSLDSISAVVNLSIEKNVELIYSNSSVFEIGLLVSVITNIPHVWHFREFGDLDYQIFPDYGKRVFNKIAELSQGLVFISKVLQEYYSEINRNCRVIYNGIIAKESLEQCSAIWQEKRNNPVRNFIIVGLIRPSKGQDTAVYAFKKVVQKYPDAFLDIVGGDQVKWIRKIVKENGLDSNVRIVGEVSNPFEYYFKADAALMCSRNEAMGRVTLEAMAAGIPVVGSNFAGTPELITDGYNGLLYDGSAEDLSRKIIYLIEHPLNSRQMGLNGINEIAEKFTIENYSGQVNEYILKIKKEFKRSNKLTFIDNYGLDQTERNITDIYNKIFVSFRNKLKENCSTGIEPTDKKNIKLPRISIITPSFNQGQFIEQTIKSVLDQKYPNFEHIVIDGGSADGTIEILKKYPHVKWISEKDNGQSDALNKGLKIADGEIIGWINSDDWYEKGAFKAISDYFISNPSENVVMGDCNLVDEKGQVFDKVINYERGLEEMINFRASRAIPTQPAIFFRKKLIDETGMLDTSLFYAMDYDLWLRFAVKNRFRHINQTVAYYRFHKDAKGGDRNWEKFVPEWEKVSGKFKNQDNPLISVIIPCYNYGKYLPEAVESVINQIYKNFEIIIVNDGSTDDTAEAAVKLAEKYSGYSITVINQENSGQPAISRNNGIKVSTGNYILTLDADDKLPADALETYISACQKFKGKSVVVFGWMQRFGMRTDCWKTKTFESTQLLRRNYVPSSSLYSRDVWDKNGGYAENVKGYEDWDFWVGAAGNNAIFINVPKVTSLYRETQSSSLQDLGRKNHEWNIANMVINHPDLYEQDEINWAADFIKENPSAPVERKLHYAGERFPLAVSLLIANYPELYTKEEVEWAASFLTGYKEQKQKKINTGKIQQQGTSDNFNALKENIRSVNGIIVKDNTNEDAVHFFQIAQKQFYLSQFAEAEKEILKYRQAVSYPGFQFNDNRILEHPLLSVIIVAYQTKTDLLKCINSVIPQIGNKAEIIVVDNGGNDEVLDELLNMPVLYIHCPENFILSEGRNIGVYFSKSPVISFLDDDAVAHPGYVAAIINCFNNYKPFGIRGKVLPKSDSKNNSVAGHYDLGMDYLFIRYIDAEGNSAFQKERYLEFSGMNPLLFGSEGFELSYRIFNKYGYGKLMYSPDVIIYHDYAFSDDKLKTKSQRHRLMKSYMQWKYQDIENFRKQESKPVPENFQIQEDDNSDIIKEVKPFISICIPTYNRAKYLEDTLKSALNQNYDNYEIILVDDGSTDNTEQIANSYKSSKIRYIRKAHTNAPDTRNTCINEANGEYILWLDSDDLLDPKLLSKYANILNEYNQPDIIFSDLIGFNEKMQVVKYFRYDDWYQRENEMLTSFFKKNPLPNPGTLIKKEVFKLVGGFDLNYTRSHDYEFWSRLALHGGFKVKHSGEALVYYRQHSDNLTGIKNQITSDCSFEVRIIQNILSKKKVEEIFMNLDWNNPEEANYTAYSFITKRFLFYNNLQGAIDILNGFLKKSSGNLKVTELLNSLLSRKDDYIQQYELLKAIYSNKPESKTAKEYKQFLKTNLSDAVINNAASTSYNPSKISDLIMKHAKKYYDNKEYYISLYLYLIIAGLIPDTWQLYFVIGNIFALIKKYDSAIEYFELAIKKGGSAKEINDLINAARQSAASLSTIDLEKITKAVFNPHANGMNLPEARAFEHPDYKKDLLLKEVESAELYLSKNKLAEALAILDNIIRVYPLFYPAVKLLRNLEKSLNWEYLEFRELKFRDGFQKSDYKDLYILQASQFQDSYKIMSLIKDYLFSKKYKTADGNQDKKISIITPVYNGQDKISKTVSSVINQTYSNWELILINDGSTDGSQEIILKIKETYNSYNITVFEQENQGPALTRNRGVSLAKSEYILFIDCGDEIVPDYLEQTIKFIEDNPEADWVYPVSLQIGKINRLWTIRDFDIYDNLTAVTQPITSLMRKSFFVMNGGFDCTFKHGYEDWDFWLTAIRKGFKGKLIPKILFIYHKDMDDEQSRSQSLHKDEETEYQTKLMLINKHRECYLPVDEEKDKLLRAQIRINRKLVNYSYKAPSVKITGDQVIGKKYTVQFYVYKSVHWPMFEELYNYLKKQPEVKEIVFCLPNIPNLIVGGSYQLVDKLMNMGERIVAQPQDAKADVTFIADTIAGKVYGCGKIVNVGHGTISKGYYFTESVWTERENWVDLLCVPGDFAANQFRQVLKTHVVNTGMPKLDPVFRGDFNRESLCRQLNLNPDKKIVLYAPTFNIDLSSVYNFAGNFNELDNDEFYVLIKLHGSTMPEYILKYREIARSSKNMKFIEDTNLAPYIGGADILISDVSSAFMEFMAMDKPVILYNNPNIKNYHGYDPENIEYKWRDLGTQVSTFSQLKNELKQIIKRGDNKSGIRKKYAGQLFSDLEGNASKNVWTETLSLLTKSLDKKSLPVLSIIFSLDSSNILFIRSAVYQVQFYSVMPVEFVMVKSGNILCDDFIEMIKDFGEYYSLKVVDKIEGCDPILQGIQNAAGDYLLIMQECTNIFKNFDYIIHKTFKNNPDLAAFTGLTVSGNPDINYENYIIKDNNSRFDRIAYDFINKYKGEEVKQLTSSEQIPHLIVLQRKLFDFTAYKSFYNIFSELSAKKKIYISLSLFYFTLDKEIKKKIIELWNYRFLIAPEKRIKLINELAKQVNICDLFELLVDDITRLGIKIPEFNSVVMQSLSQRFYDIKYKQKLEKICDNKVFLTYLKKDIEILTALQSNVLQKSIDKRPLRLLLYFFKNVHVPILTPIYNYLKINHPEIELAIGYMWNSPEFRAGFSEEELILLKNFGEPLYSRPQEYSPDITIIADSCYEFVQNCGMLVHVGHGILSKGQYYTDTKLARREEFADLVCVPGEYHKKIMNRIISKTVVAAGMAKLDDLFSGKICRESVLKKYKLPSDFKYILFAPTFNDELSSIPFVKDRINEIIPDNRTFLLIKLHGSTKNEYREMYKKLFVKDARVIYIDELDITPFMALADVMVSDVSSAMMEFAALNKPVILFNNPDWKKYQHYNPSDIEFKWRDIGIQVNNLEEMKEAVARSFANADEFAGKRKFYTDQLIANKYEGNACKVIIDTILEFYMKGVEV